MSLPQPPDESSETSFWAAVYDEDPPHIICGVLTDLNLHRFTLHQHLSTTSALTETPLLHQAFQDALPPALHRQVRNYTTNLHLANVQDDPPLSTSADPPFPTQSTLSPGQPVNLPPCSSALFTHSPTGNASSTTQLHTDHSTTLHHPHFSAN